MSKSVARVFYAAHMKKLRWALSERKKQAARRATSSAADVCIVCEKKRVLHSNDNCELCGALVCSVCRITHKVASVERDNEMHWTKVHACPLCMARAINSDTAAVIRGEIEAGWYETH